MAKVVIKLSYNPYTGSSGLSQICADKEIPITEQSALSPILTDRLPRWVAPNGHWRGLFPELVEYYGTLEFEIHYLGLEEDFRLLENARTEYAIPRGIEVELHYDTSAQGRQNNTGANKLEKVRMLRSQFPEMGLAELQEAGVPQIFDSTLNGLFEIGVVAPVSAGKSTLQNALVGRRNLPTGARATTAVLTCTRINPRFPDFQVKAQHHDRWVTFQQPFTRELVRQLNDGMDPNDPEGAHVDWSQIYLEGPVFRHPLDCSRRFDEGNVELILTDSPGGNNAGSALHSFITQSLLENENKSIVLFVFSAETLDNTDTRAALEDTLRTVGRIIRQGSHGKLSKDRFLFVCNHADEITEPYRSCYDDIRRLLEQYGITDPNLFLVSAYTAELIRSLQRSEILPSEQKQAGDELTETERYDAERLICQFSEVYDESEDFAPEVNDDQALYHFSSLPDDVKQKFDEQVELLRRQDPGTRSNREVALIHSGIPALEYTIAEYIDRYAVPLKIQQLHDNILRKIQELKLVEDFQDKLLADRKKLEATRKEVISKQAELNGAYSIQPYLEELRTREYDTSNIIALQATLKRTLRANTNQLLKGYVSRNYVRDGETVSCQAIPRADLDRFITQQQQIIREQYDMICRKIVDQINTDVIAQCRRVEQEFENYVNSLKREGIFDIAGMKIDALHSVPPEIEQIRPEPDIEIINEHVRTEKVQKEGFLNAIFAFFDVPFAFEEKEIYEDVEYVSVREVYEDLLAPANTAFDTAVRETLEESRKRVSDIKQKTEYNLKLLDDYIQKCLEEWKRKLEDVQTLQNSCANTRRLLQNAQTLIRQIDAILEMEE